MLDFIFGVEILVMLGLPVALWLILRKRFGVTWGIIVAGVVTFLISQIVHLPLLAGFRWLQARWPFEAGSTAALVASAAFAGLAAGICEEGARYVVLRYWQKEVRTWLKGVAFGLGHGGAESIILGLLVLISFASMVSLRGADLEALGLSGEALEQAEVQIEAFAATPWYLPLLGALERVFAMVLQIAFSLLVVHSLVRNNLGWLGLAVLSHSVVDAVSVGLIQAGWSPVLVEGVVFLFAIAAALTIIKLRDVSRETST